MANVNEYLRLTFTAQIRNLTDQCEVATAEMDGIIEGIEVAGTRIEESREDIKSLERLIKDLQDNVIIFGNKRIDNLKSSNDERLELIAGLREKLEALTDPEPTPVKSKEAPKVARAPRTMYGELTDDQKKIIRKKYAVLLELRGHQLYDYMEFLKSKGRSETNKAISLSLGKNPNWYSTMSGLARKAGYDA